MKKAAGPPVARFPLHESSRPVLDRPRGPGQRAADRCIEKAGDQLLLTGTPREVLARIVPGDALGIRVLASERLRKRALFLDLEGLCLRAFAGIARDAFHWRGRPELACWLVARVDRAIEDILAEERDHPTTPAEGGAGTGGQRLSPAFVQLARPLGLDPDALRSACARFHALDPKVREVFFQLVVEGCSLDHLALSTGFPVTTLARHARRALEVFRRPEGLPHHLLPEVHPQQLRATS